jgi:hypothetical protein
MQEVVCLALPEAEEEVRERGKRGALAGLVVSMNDVDGGAGRKVSSQSVNAP